MDNEKIENIVEDLEIININAVDMLFEAEEAIESIDIKEITEVPSKHSFDEAVAGTVEEV